MTTTERLEASLDAQQRIQRAGLYVPHYAMNVHLGDFEGPLDLLLYLIRAQDMDILDIPIARITEQYLLFVQRSLSQGLTPGSEYLVMVAKLLSIKSRELRPEAPLDEEAEDDPREALQARLLEYERYRQAAQALDARERLDRDVFVAAAQTMGSAPKRWPDLKLTSLVNCYQQLQRMASYRKLLTIARAHESLSQCIKRIRHILSHYQGWTNWMNCLGEHVNKTAVVMSFVAVIHLIHEGWAKARIEPQQSQLELLYKRGRRDGD